MAEKETSIYIVDVGKEMGMRHEERTMTDLDWGMLYVWNKITDVVRH